MRVCTKPSARIHGEGRKPKLLLKVESEKLVEKKMAIGWLPVTAEHWPQTQRPQQPGNAWPSLEPCGTNLINIFTAGAGNCLCWDYREWKKPNHCCRERSTSPLFAESSPGLQLKAQSRPLAEQQQRSRCSNTAASQDGHQLSVIFRKKSTTFNLLEKYSVSRDVSKRNKEKGKF